MSRLYVQQSTPWYFYCNFSIIAERHWISFRICCCLIAKSCLTVCNPMDCSPPGSLSMGFSRQEYQSGLAFPSPVLWDQFSSVQLLSCVQLFAIPWTAACQTSLSITNSQSLPKLMSIESVMPSNHLIFCRPFSSCLQSFPASGSFPMSVFWIRWPKYCSFSFSISPSNEYSRLISFTMDWSDLLEVQGTLKHLL